MKHLNRWLLLVVAVSLAGCGQQPGEPSAAEKALGELQRKYDEVVRERGDDPLQWASEDLENLGDWEYRVEDLPAEPTDELAASLNKLGDDRWEVYWVQERDGQLRFFLKRTSVSYLGKIPLSQLGRFVTDPGGTP